MSKNNLPGRMVLLALVLGLGTLLANPGQAAAATAANTPGVYVSEISLTPAAIRGLPTAIAAFVGPADAGPLLRPTRIIGWTDYRAKFGGSLSAASYAAHAVKGFFDNGGTECWFVRVGAAAPSQSSSLRKLPTPTVNTPKQENNAILPQQYKAGIDALEQVREVTIVSVPGNADREVQAHLIRHCEIMKNRFAILDAGAGSTTSDILEQRRRLNSPNGYAAIYYPWIKISNPNGAGVIAVPPSGHIAGVYARTDASSGVHKSPASTEVRGSVDLERRLTDSDQDYLSLEGINAIRYFSGRGILVWGARTLAVNQEWKYIAVRRQINFLASSIEAGTRYALFEPDSPQLRAVVQAQVSSFLNQIWLNGGLQGQKAEHAYFVKIEPFYPSGGQTGKFVILVGVAQLRPAEFNIFRVVV